MSSEGSLPVGAGGVPPHFDFVPIFECDSTMRAIEFRGTGFRLRPNLLITCWHCVERSDFENELAIAMPTGENHGFQLYRLTHVQRDQNGADLASARVVGGDGVALHVNLTLATTLAHAATRVGSWAYPFTTRNQAAEGRTGFRLEGRWLQGYVTRICHYEHPSLGTIEAYELDMPAPRGVSGAPMMSVSGTSEVFGVIFGAHDTAMIEHSSLVDPVTGDRSPEVQRIVSFALATSTEALRSMGGDAFDGLSLVDYLQRESAP